ncbi:CheC, inhibitor of MCP methylation / FliN fusion protein [Thermodesulfobium narugense DSM 14796]|uniref:Flagellar motor switch protein FliN n=1 Tax=Thermodesulfobium narugense DSM 14796 TaxID=747365 RepID=M1E9K0_9BACT|nr:flagellar motor switch phosphatase FliY [Thermodesulfobium narugense]AEE15414.1 CheC, inhibitor of MCP methylation / FliN fusion protein [Thermodesulfobium narugense DSM 14796]
MNLTDEQIDAIGEVLNMAMGSAATTLSQLVNKKISITSPMVDISDIEQIAADFEDNSIGVMIGYEGEVEGSSLLVVKKTDGSIIADLMMGGEGNPELPFDELAESALQEAMNQMMGAASTALASLLGGRINIMPPSVVNFDEQPIVESLKQIASGKEAVEVLFDFTGENVFQTKLVMILSEPVAQKMAQMAVNKAKAMIENQDDSASKASSLENQSTTMSPQSASQPLSAAGSTAVNSSIPQSGVQQPPYSYPPQASQQNPYNYPPPPYSYPPPPPTYQQQPQIQASQAQFQQLQPSPQGDSINIENLLNIPLELSVSLGNAKMTLKDVLELRSGSVIELNKLAGEALEVMINDELIARGEVVVIDENFGIRITEIISPRERLEKI